MLLHTLPISPVVVRYPERPQPVQFSAIPRIPIWSWLGPVAAGEALTTIAVPACMLLHASSPQWLPFHVVAIAFGSLLIWFMAAQSQRLYRPLQGPYAFRLESFGTAGVLWLFGVSILLLAAEPRIAGRDATEALGAGLGLMFALRLFWRARLRARLRGGSCIDRALVMATDRATARAAADELEEAFGQCVRAAVCIPLPGSANAPSLAWIEDAICSHMVDQVYIVGCNNLDAAFTDVLPQLAGLDIDVVLLSERPGVGFAPVCCSRIGRLYAFPLSSRAMGPVRAWAKRAMDLAIVSAVCLLCGPVLALLAIMVKLDSSGPVLFTQRREGLHGRVFRVFKFRTMFTHVADELAYSQTTRDDKRVTAFGRILRRLSLDEVPQLINVLRGDMSVVGPRPHAIGMTVDGRSLHDTLAEYRIRHRVKPGITGWAQINGCRGEVTTEGKLRRRITLDCEYIERCSIAMDSWILLRTLATLLFDKQAF